MNKFQKWWNEEESAEVPSTEFMESKRIELYNIAALERYIAQRFQLAAGLSMPPVQQLVVTIDHKIAFATETFELDGVSKSMFKAVWLANFGGSLNWNSETYWYEMPVHWRAANSEGYTDTHCFDMIIPHQYFVLVNKDQEDE